MNLNRTYIINTQRLLSWLLLDSASHTILPHHTVLGQSLHATPHTRESFDGRHGISAHDLLGSYCCAGVLEFVSVLMNEV